MNRLSPISCFCILQAEAELMLNDKLPEKTAALRLSALRRLPGYLDAYLKIEMMPEIVDIVCKKKIAFIMRAETAGEIREIMQPPRPVNTGNGINCKSPYHIPEEELMLWAYVSPCNKLISEASERYMSLFKQVFGVSIKDYDGRKPL